MILDKGLILKGIAGVAAVAGGGVGIAYGTGAFSSRKDEINEKLTALGLDGCHLEDNNFTDQTFSKECELDQDKFKKIKFSNKDGNNNVNVTGWTGNNTVKLTISNKDDGGIKFLFKDVKDDLTISKSSTDQTDKFSIRKGKETEFEEKPVGKLGKVIDESLKNKLEGYNKKLGNLSLPDSCRFDVTEKDKSLECSLDEGKLKAIKFSNKGNGDLTVSGTVPSDLKIKVEAKDGENDATFSFLGLTDDLTIIGDKNEGKIVLKSSSSSPVRTFKEKNGKLEKVPADDSLSTKLKEFNKKLSDLNVPDGCRFDEGEGDTSIECGITEDNLKKINFSNKGTEDLKINNWGSNGNVKLKVEKESSTSEMKISFQGVTEEIRIHGAKNEGKIVLKQNGGTQTFKEENGKLTKTPVNNSNKTKYQGFNKQLGGLDIPVECRFDEAENDSTVTCTVSKEDLKKIKFWNKGEGDLTIDDENGFTPPNMEINGSSTDMKIYFKNLAKTVKITDGGSNSFNLRSNGSSDEFEIRSGVLGQVRKAKEEGEKVGLICTHEGNGNNGKCRATGSSVKVSSGSTNGTVSISNTNEDIFDFFEYEDGYNLKIKFTFKGQTTTAGSNNLQLENNGNYELQNKSDVWYLVKKNGRSR